MKNKKKVLVIEDDRVLVEALRTEFEDFGFALSVFTEGEGAYEEVVKIKPDIIILDLVLPGVHGFDILKRLKEDDAVKKIPVIIATNLGEVSDKDKALKMGAIDFYVKAEVDLRELSKRICKILNCEYES